MVVPVATKKNATSKTKGKGKKAAMFEEEEEAEELAVDDIPVPAIPAKK